MLKRFASVVAFLLLVGSIVVGSFATYVYLAASDEERLYDQKHQEATEKLKKAESARGTAAEAQLAKEAKEAAASAAAWGRGSRERTQSNRLGVLASGSVALLSFIVLVITFLKPRKRAEREKDLVAK